MLVAEALFSVLFYLGNNSPSLSFFNETETESSSYLKQTNKQSLLL